VIDRSSFVLLAVLAATVPAFAATSKPLIVPKGTQFVVLLPNEIAMNGARGQAGVQKVKMSLVNDVVVKGAVVAKAGDTVDAESNSTYDATAGHVKTTLTLDVNDVANFCGDTIPLAGHFEKEGSIGMFGRVKGASFGKGSLYLAATDRVVKNVCSEKTTETPAPVPSNAATPSS